MFKVLSLLGLCVACSPASDNRGDTVTPTARNYATQTRAPSPDYRALLNQSSQAADGGRQREATSPLPPNAKRIGETWVARLKKRGALLGFGLAGKSSDGPVDMIDTGLTEEEFVRWTNENNWDVPTHIRWHFVPVMNLPRVSDAAKKTIRVWPASISRTGLQHQALYRGRVELRNGCFFVGEFEQATDKLAWFHAEMGLDIDDSGYFILRDRISGRTLARLGEEMNWGGPASADIDAEIERVLQDACGPAEIYVVGSPEARERFLTQYPHLRESQVSPPPPPPGI
ncbi:hypothetical protein GCM10011494_32740 [Novosphingobium endophyticum]|uniref:Uncharacterized protein n=1 Tax=Novosphingobium endophyticum TaxID=1955250 RepID=A0A916TVC7_9SPHN|nr:hypothetical protein [Novosphingobium endophyticum]GGC11418.1 hypothetical protein GCM10011494_32740 [Novosphingobium endophyticum]